MRKILALIIAAALMLPNIVFAEDGLTPYMEHVLPCTVQAVDFDYGGAGVAFSPLAGGLDDGIFSYRDDAELNYYKQSRCIKIFQKGEVLLTTGFLLFKICPSISMQKKWSISGVCFQNFFKNFSIRFNAADIDSRTELSWTPSIFAISE